MTKWLAESTKIQVDYRDAFEGVLWGLRPRWYGSHKEMVKFGEACWRSGRYDSGIPWYMLEAHLDAASEWDLPEYYFREMRDFDKFHGNV